MHPTLFRPRTLLLGGLLLALVLAGRPDALTAQIPGTTGNALVVPIGGTVPLQITTKKAITLVKNTKEDILGIKTVAGDPTRVLLTGQTAGISHLDLTDVDGKVESYDVTVQLDVEYLRTQLRRALPTANIDPVPIANNTIVLRGTVNHIEDVEIAVRAAQAAVAGVQVVSDLRVAGVQQVQLCVTVAQVSRSQLRAMNFDFLTDSKNFFLGSTIGGAVAQPALVGTGGTLTTTLNGQTLSGVPGGSTNLLFGVLHNRWGFLGFLQALRNEGVTKSLAEPTMTTLSGRPASFLVGGEQAVPVPAGLGQVGVQFEEFGTRLNFVPIVLGNGKIHLEVEPEVSRLDAANGTVIQGTTVPGRVTSRVNTTVELEDGQTFVIGGLIERDVQATDQKTPILGDLPFLGAAFSAKSYQETEEETVILVTPHLVDAEDCSQAPKILPGDETRRPDDFELFLEGILEAPRGPREVFPGGRYMAAYKNSPTASLFPCAGNGANGSCGCNAGGCAAGRSDAAAPVPATLPAVPNAAPATINLTPLRSAAPAAPPEAAFPAEAAAPAAAPVTPELPAPGDVGPAAASTPPDDPR